MAKSPFSFRRSKYLDKDAPYYEGSFDVFLFGFRIGNAVEFEDGRIEFYNEATEKSRSFRNRESMKRILGRRIYAIQR